MIPSPQSSVRRLLPVVSFCIFCLAPAVQSQQSKKKAAKPAASAPKTAAGAVSAPYPYLEAIHQNDLGLDLMARSQFGDAFAKFQTACIMDIDSDVGCQNAGIALIAMKNYDDARKMLQKAAERNPQYARAWLGLAIIEKAQDHTDAALADLEKVAAIDPADADSECLLGELYLEEKQYDKAVAAFSRAIAADPLLSSAELGLAQAKQATGDMVGSLAHLSLLEDMSAKNTGKTVDFAYGKAGKYSEAEKIVPPQGSESQSPESSVP